MLDPIEDFFHRAGNDASVRVVRRILEAFHGVRLACARLPVCQYRGVVALEDGADGRFCSCFVHVLLRRIHVVHLVEAVSVPHRQVWVELNILSSCLVLQLTTEVLHNRDASVVRTHLHNGEEEVTLLLSREGRPQPDDHFEVVGVRGALARLEATRVEVAPIRTVALAPSV